MIGVGRDEKTAGYWEAGPDEPREVCALAAGKRERHITCVEREYHCLLGHPARIVLRRSRSALEIWSTAREKERSRPAGRKEGWRLKYVASQVSV